MARRAGSTRTHRTWWRVWLKRLAQAAAVVALVTAVALASFVGTRCYSGVGDPGISAAPPDVPGYRRAESFSLLTLPEWYIVYSTDELGRYLRGAPPSGFPYLGAVRQYWATYDAACQATRGRYPFELGYQVMLGVIGVSLTAEYGIKAAYEGTIGRITGWLSGTDTAEDAFAAVMTTEYGTFMHTTPWYQFPFAARLRTLWGDVPWWGPHPLRKWERRAALTLELGVKALYGGVMGMGSQAAYGAEDLTTYGRILVVDSTALAAVGGRLVPSKDPVPIVGLPRYEAFTPAAIALLARGQRFRDIAGNDGIVVGLRAPADAQVPLVDGARIVLQQPILTSAGRNRVAVFVPVARLHEALAAWTGGAIAVEHVYDY